MSFKYIYFILVPSECELCVSKVPKPSISPYISIVNRAPIWRTIKQLTKLKPTRHVIMKDRHTCYRMRGDARYRMSATVIAFTIYHAPPFINIHVHHPAKNLGSAYEHTSKSIICNGRPPEVNLSTARGVQKIRLYTFLPTFNIQHCRNNIVKRLTAIRPSARG